jgi:membrane associated rhomboid family serine protease
MGVPLPMWAALAAYVFINVAGLTAVNNTAYEAHLLGMVIGVVVGLYLREDIEQTDEDRVEEENWRERIREWEDKWMM